MGPVNIETMGFRERAELWAETHAPLFRATSSGKLIWQGPSQDGLWYKPLQQESSEGSYVIYTTQTDYSP